jgi:hypothetical protein
VTTVSRSLPKAPDLDVPQRQARELLAAWRDGEHAALDRIRRRHPKFAAATDAVVAAGPFRSSDAELVIAREYGLAHWPELTQRIALNTHAQALAVAIRADDLATAVRLVQEQPQLLHLPLVSGNWGPPMSHAANLGRLAAVKAMAGMGAQDFQHAFGRAVLQGHIDCARWLLEHGATLEPGILMGACEALDPAGMRFIAELDGPFTDEHGNRLAPLAMVLETYSRNAQGKHEMLELLAQRGCELPDTPIMAFHRGDIGRLESHLRREPRLLERRFTLAEIYPEECGCAPGGRSGMHWTPIGGTTLLHLALDFHEPEIALWLLSNGADVNAPAELDADGFGGHTPLFHAVVCGPWHGAEPVRLLLQHGASKDARASLRKFLDWVEEPRWHEARNATAAEWARGFPDQGWVNGAALRLLD